MRIFSTLAAALLFLTMNSLVIEVPSAKDLLASSCAVSTALMFEAMEARTATARLPSSFMSLNTGISCWNPPCSLKAESTVRMALLASVWSNCEKSSTSILAIRAKVAVSENIRVIKPWKAVAAISTFCPFWSRAEP